MFHFSIFINYLMFGFHSCTMHLDIIKVFYLPTDAQQSCFKRILKFTLKQLLHVSVQTPSSGSVLFELAKVIVIKIISFKIQHCSWFSGVAAYFIRSAMKNFVSRS